MEYDIALVGLGVMGQALARNLAGHRLRTLVFNRTLEKSREFAAKYGSRTLESRENLASMVAGLKRPRKIILMVKAGEAVDHLLLSLLPLLTPGDILIDAGNSYYRDTQRRAKLLKEKHEIEWVGLGVSGGEEGALLGPSLMPGCTEATWKILRPVLQKIAAKDFRGRPCVTRVGSDGAGHFVKMVHNGIEYGIMQMMAEAYEMLRMIYKLPAPKIAAIFERLNRGSLKSFLFEIAGPVLKRKEAGGKEFLINLILDRAGQKGTGRWVAIDALEQGLPLPTITEAVHARSLSGLREERVALHALYQSFKSSKSRSKPPLAAFIKKLESALYASILSNYAQGFEQIRAASHLHQWDIHLDEIARIWQGGCIIRAKLLGFIQKALGSAKKEGPFLALPPVQKILRKDLPAWREALSLAVSGGVAAPSLCSALAYFEMMTSARLPANFIQGLRDYFGAHTYERVDRPGIFHTQWHE